MQKPRIIIIGAGFGGLFAARALANKPVEVLLIDRSNFHTFTPLLYQVATCALDPSEIAYPVRTIFRKNRNIRSLLGNVSAVDYANKMIEVQIGERQLQEPYDYLILATGSTPTYFGNDGFRKNALELRTLNDAINLRNHILSLFEQATWEDDDTVREAMTTIVVVGGGPTGLETAGAIYELYNHVLNREYLHREMRTRVILVEMQPHLLAPYPDKLRQAALERAQAQLLEPGDIAGDGAPLRVLAPHSGVVLAVTDESARPVQAGAPLMSLGDLGDLDIETDLLSTDAVRVAVGASAEIERWGGVGVLPAVVRRIEPAAFTRVSALGIEEQRVRLRLDFTAPPADRPGLGDRYRVFVRITVWQGDDLVLVPQAALFRSGGGWAVFRAVDGLARLTPVTVGPQAEGQAEVVSGLEPGERVVLYPPTALAPGARVVQRPE